jgi:hypothetical protein
MRAAAAELRASGADVRSLVVVLGLVLLTCASRETAPSRAGQVTVCEIVGHPDAYVGRSVTVAAPIQSDWIHTTLVMGPECARGIAISLPESPDDGGLLEAISKPWPGTGVRKSMLG